jgi:hypothetical protein
METLTRGVIKSFLSRKQKKQSKFSSLNKYIFLLFMGSMLHLSAVTKVAATTIRSNGTGGGDWNTETTWIGGVVPAATDNVIIQGSDVVTLAAAGSCANLTMNAGTKLTITAGGPIPGSSWSLNPASTIEFNTIVPNIWVNPTFGNLIFDIPDYSLHPNINITVAGDLSILNNTLRGIGTVSGTNIHNIAGNVTLSGTGRITAVNQSSPTSASCTWNIGGNLTLSSTSNRMQFYESAGPHTGSAVFNINGNLTVNGDPPIGVVSRILLKSTSPSTADYPEGIINLKGNFVNNGTIGVSDVTSGTSPGLSINFVGTSPQDWSGTGKFSVSGFSVNMNINNPAGVTLSRQQDISTGTVVILTNGKLTTTSTNLLRIEEKGSLIGGSSSSYINGPLARRIISGLQNPVFPIGDAAKYTPVNLEFLGDVNEGTITVSTTPGIHPQIATSGLNSSKTLNRYYTVKNTIATFGNVTATFNFDPTDVIGGADPTKYVVKKFDTGTWTTPTTANPLATSIQATGVTSLNSDFAVGELQGTLIYKITGYIKNACDVPIAGVAVDANNGGSSDITDANGHYEVWVGDNWSGIVTPSKAYYTFEPNSKAYTNVLADKTDQSYLADNIYDLDCDGSIGFGDLAIMCEHWLKTGLNVPGDFNNDGIVNFLDFAKFAQIWQEQ